MLFNFTKEMMIMRLLIRGAILCALVALTLTASANDKGIDIKVDVNDFKAPRSPIRSFSASNMTFGEMRKKVGRLASHQTVGIWCEGATMGTNGVSAFDVLYGNEIAENIRKYHPRPNMPLVDVCIADNIDFKAKQMK